MHGEGRWSGLAEIAAIPDGVLASALPKPGEYDARRLRSQREIIRDVMISAAVCETWLTLGAEGDYALWRGVDFGAVEAFEKDGERRVLD
jgi:hypothetical protein